MKKDLVSMNDLQVEDIRRYLELAHRIETMDPRAKASMLLGKVLMVMFYEPSTRTRLSFESAMCRLGGSVIGFSETGNTSVAKGETFADTVRTVEQYADAMVVRHPREGAARLASTISRIPVINAGDGTNQHPTQTLLDLYTIWKLFGRVEGVRIAFAGDLKYSRTIHSLLQALVKLGNRDLVLVSPTSLQLPDYLKVDPSGQGLNLEETTDIQEALETCDVVYMTRIQKERFPDPLDYEKVKNSYCITASMLANARPGMKLLHPLPRVGEIATDVDVTDFAHYFPQVGNGVTMRQAILLDLMGVEL